MPIINRTNGPRTIRKVVNSTPELDPVPTTLPERASERTERLSINIFDLDGVDPCTRAKTLLRRLDLKTPIRLNSNKGDEVSVAFTCSLLDAACICDILRSENRRLGDRSIRIYLKRSEDAEWEKVSDIAIFTRQRKGKFELSPSIFPPSKEAMVPSVALKQKKPTQVGKSLLKR